MARFLVEQASVRFGDLTAVDAVDARIDPGEAVGIVGPSGAGKTTLLRLLNGFDSADGRRISVDGVALDTLSNADCARFARGSASFIRTCGSCPTARRAKRRVGAQSAVEGSFRRCGPCSFPGREDTERAHTILERVGIPEKLFERTDSLSGGQRQRVAIAGRSFQDPEALLADEPVSSVDPARARDTVELLARIGREEGLTVCVSLHTSNSLASSSRASSACVTANRLRSRDRLAPRRGLRSSLRPQRVRDASGLMRCAARAESSCSRSRSSASGPRSSSTSPRVQLIPRERGWEVTKEFFAAALRPAVTDADGLGIDLWRRAAIGGWTTVKFAAAAMSLALLLGFVFGLFSSADVLGARDRPTTDSARPHQTRRRTDSLLGVARVHRDLAIRPRTTLGHPVLGGDRPERRHRRHLDRNSVRRDARQGLLGDARRSPTGCGGRIARSRSHDLEGHSSSDFFRSRCPDMAAYAFYRFECAIRSAAILGSSASRPWEVSSNQAFELNLFRQVWTYLYVLFALVILVDWWSGLLRRKLVAA